MIQIDRRAELLAEARRRGRDLLERTVVQNRWIPHTPSPHQGLFLSLPVREAAYGGAAGGGKSDALLMDALKYVDVPGYHALLLRRSYADLALPGAIMDRAHDWLGGTAAEWNDNDKQWTFPSGAVLNFGYLQRPNDHYRYQGADFQFVGFDELTQFVEAQYLYLFSRGRRLKGFPVPVRQRGATNPGGIGHEWVYERFFGPDAAAKRRVFVPAKLKDNPHLDQDDYARSLDELDPTTKDQLLRGVWVLPTGARNFDRAWWRGQNRYDPTDEELAWRAHARYISFDTAEVEEEGSAYTAWAVGDLVVPPNTLGDRLLIREIGRARLQFPDLLDRITEVATRWNHDGKLERIVIENKSSGTSAYQTLRAQAASWLADILAVYNPRVSKQERWRLAAAWCKEDCVWLPHLSEATAAWMPTFTGELFALPDAEFKDQGDAFAQLILYLRRDLQEGYMARNQQLRAA